MAYTDQKAEGNMKCYCENSKCDHDVEHGENCQREASGHVRMDYVGQTCDTCAANMCVTGGAEYIHLREEEPEPKQPTPVGKLALDMGFKVIMASGAFVLIEAQDGKGFRALERDDHTDKLLFQAAYDDYYKARRGLVELATRRQRLEDEAQAISDAQEPPQLAEYDRDFHLKRAQTLDEAAALVVEFTNTSLESGATKAALAIAEDLREYAAEAREAANEI